MGWSATLAGMADSLPPEEIPPYRCLHRLGAGGMGEVWLGLDTRSGERVALKIARSLPGDQGTSRMRREAELLSRLRSPWLPRFRSLVETGERLVLVMDFVDGTSVEAALRTTEGPADRRDLLASVAPALAGGLADLHGAGILHRDVKPQNLMVGREGGAVLVDLGLARAVGVATLTRTGSAVGTPEYLPPEMIRNEAVGPRADLYQAALVVLRILQGPRSISPGAAFDEALRRSRQRPEDPRKELPWLDPELARWIEDCLHPDPGLRPDPAAALARLPGLARDALQAAARGRDATVSEGRHGAQGPTPRPVAPPRVGGESPPARSDPPRQAAPPDRRPTAGAALALLAAGAMGYWFGSHAGGHTSRNAPGSAPAVLLRHLVGSTTVEILDPRDHKVEIRDATVPGGGLLVLLDGVATALPCRLPLELDKLRLTRRPDGAASLQISGLEPAARVRTDSGLLAAVGPRRIAEVPLPKDGPRPGPEVVAVSPDGRLEILLQVDVAGLQRSALEGLDSPLLDRPGPEEARRITGLEFVTRPESSPIPPAQARLLLQLEVAASRWLFASIGSGSELAEHAIRRLAYWRHREWFWRYRVATADGRSTRALGPDLLLSDFPSLGVEDHPDQLFQLETRRGIRLGPGSGLKDLLGASANPRDEGGSRSAVILDGVPAEVPHSVELGFLAAGGSGWVAVKLLLPAGRTLEIPLGDDLCWRWQRLPPQWIWEGRTPGGTLEFGFEIETGPGFRTPDRLAIDPIALRGIRASGEVESGPQP